MVRALGSMSVLRFGLVTTDARKMMRLPKNPLGGVMKTFSRFNSNVVGSLLSIAGAKCETYSETDGLTSAATL